MNPFQPQVPGGVAGRRNRRHARQEPRRLVAVWRYRQCAEDGRAKQLRGLGHTNPRPRRMVATERPNPNKVVGARHNGDPGRGDGAVA